MTRFSNMRVDQRFTGSLRDEIRSACCAGKEAFDSPKMAAQVTRQGARSTASITAATSVENTTSAAATGKGVEDGAQAQDRPHR